MQGGFTLEARDVGIQVPHRHLIERVSLTVSPSELVCIMGPSGAGKTTLLTALNGYARPTNGTVLFNGSDLYANHEQFRRSVGYVPQDDIVHRELTVRQALYFSARIRLPRSSPRQINSRISSVLAQLGLNGIEGMVIGSPDAKSGISGGERKRVNLAMELLTDPLLMFLDEPTSGLSSGDALIVMQLLRKLADTGRTIVLTVHQPTLEMFRLVDKVAFVAKEPRGPGQLVYYGRAYPDAVDFLIPKEFRTCRRALVRRQRRLKPAIGAAVKGMGIRRGLRVTEHRPKMIRRLHRPSRPARRGAPAVSPRKRHQELHPSQNGWHYPREESQLRQKTAGTLACCSSKRRLSAS